MTRNDGIVKVPETQTKFSVIVNFLHYTVNPFPVQPLYELYTICKTMSQSFALDIQAVAYLIGHNMQVEIFFASFSFNECLVYYTKFYYSIAFFINQLGIILFYEQYMLFSVLRLIVYIQLIYYFQVSLTKYYLGLIAQLHPEEKKQHFTVICSNFGYRIIFSILLLTAYLNDIFDVSGSKSRHNKWKNLLLHFDLKIQKKKIIFQGVSTIRLF